MNLCKLLTVVLFFSIFFSACQSNGTKTKHPKPDSTGYIAPLPGKIPVEEFNYLHNAVKDYYENKLVKRGFNGGMLVAKKGNIIFEDYNGYFNMKTKEPLTKHSPFHLASVSKTFTAMATLKLAEMGKLSLEDSVQKFFPAFPYKDVTIKLLLSHRSGLPNYIHFMEKLGWNRKQYCSNEDVMDYLIKYKPAGTGLPDTHFTYCNTNYAILALIIEKASGQSYSDFLSQYFFKPLQMNDTYVFSMKDSARSMPSYDRAGRLEAFTFLDVGLGDKNIFSTPEDLLKWDQALYTHEIFSEKTLEEAFTPYSNEKPGIRNYGYGWRMNVYPDGRKVIYHNGWWHGNNTVFIRMIQDSVTIIVLGNKYNSNIYRCKEIGKIFNEHSFEGDDNGEVLNTTSPFTMADLTQMAMSKAIKNN